MATDLTTHIASFKDWLKSGTGNAATWQKERKDHLAWYREHLTAEKLAKLTGEDFATPIKGLWAVNIWQNKDYKVQQLIKDNGLEKLRDAMAALLRGLDPIDKRWDNFRATIKGFGPAMLSEILTFFDPQQYALINLKPYRVLPLIGFSISPVSDGKSYRKAVEEIGKIKILLSQHWLKDADFIQTDLFIAYLFYEVFDLQFKTKGEFTELVGKGRKGSTSEPPANPSLPTCTIIDCHEGAEALLLELGKLLGYDTYTPDAGRTYKEKKLGDIATLKDLPYFTSAKIMDSVQNIDVVWLKDDWPDYFFEVEHTTGVTSGLLRIYQAQKLNTKFFIVGPKDVLKKFEKEVEKAPFNSIKEKYYFRSYEELADVYQAAWNYRKGGRQVPGVSPPCFSDDQIEIL